MDALKDVIVVRPLPKRFLYRGDVIVTEKITPEQAQTLANDKKFHAIQPKAAAEAPKKAGPNDDGKK